MSEAPGKAFPLRRLSVVVSTMGAGQVVLLTLVPVISALCGLSIASIGSIVALGTFCFMFTGPLWGALSDRLGCKPVILLGLGGALLAQCLFVLLLLLLAMGKVSLPVGLFWLGLSRIIYGLFASGIFPSSQAWSVENSPAERRLATLSGLSAAANLGRVVGPLLALPALIFAGSGLQALWPLLWLLLLPGLGLLLVFPIRSVTTAVQTQEDAQEKRPMSLMLVALFAVALLGTAAIGQTQMLLGPVLADYYALNPVDASTWSAFLLLAVAVIMVLVQLGFVRRINRPRLCLALGAGLMLVGVIALWFSLGQYLATLGLVLFIAGVACLVPGYTTLVSEQGGQNKRGRIFGLLTLMHTAGYTAGFAFGGWNYTYLGAWPLLGLLFAVLLVGLAVLLALTTGRKLTTTTA